MSVVETGHRTNFGSIEAARKRAAEAEPIKTYEVQLTLWEDPERVTLQCPYCFNAFPVTRDWLGDFGGSKAGCRHCGCSSRLPRVPT